jgi:N-acetylglutamate synthase-like GNAT family acetyltransferase
MTVVTIRDQFNKGDIKQIIERHRAIYEKEYGFDRSFGDYVADSLTRNVEHLWIAERNGKFVGCIGLIEADEKTGQLRWFLVEPDAQGSGVGKVLMQKLLDRCKEKQYGGIFLWTVNKLPAARSIYERFGFKLTQKKPEKLLWGQNLIEERWDLSMKSDR